MHVALQKVRAVLSRTFEVDEDLVLMGGGGGGDWDGGWLGPRAMTSLCAHVILLR